MIALSNMQHLDIDCNDYLTAMVLIISILSLFLHLFCLSVAEMLKSRRFAGSSGVGRAFSVLCPPLVGCLVQGKIEEDNWRHDQLAI